MDIDIEWKQYLLHQSDNSDHDTQVPPTKSDVHETAHIMPKCEDLYISTQTKVLFLNQEIDIHRIFWEIPIVEYWRPMNGVVKKQMKIVSKTPEEYEEYRAKLQNIPYFTEHIIKQINNPGARRIKFKDERKITVGISKKDIMNCRGKVKNAFYNCFAMILRFKYDEDFREIHVKIFNTGKMEIPGILNDKLLQIVKTMILDILRARTEMHLERANVSRSLQPDVDDAEDVDDNECSDCVNEILDTTHANEGLLKEVEEVLEPSYTIIDFVENEKEDSVLINSNFNCGFYINRERLYSILRSEKYNIEAAYDPCSYPGVKCKFYFIHEIGFDVQKQRGCITREDRCQKMSELGDNKRYTEVSFMVFRTGSCLIVGNCSETILKFIFEFIKLMLAAEYELIYTAMEDPVSKNKKMKIRKKTIAMTQTYYDTII